LGKQLLEEKKHNKAVEKEPSELEDKPVAAKESDQKIMTDCAYACPKCSTKLLLFADKQRLVKHDSRYRIGFCCSECGTEKFPVWHCDGCDYDMCTDCSSSAKDACPAVFELEFSARPFGMKIDENGNGKGARVTVIGAEFEELLRPLKVGHELTAINSQLVNEMLHSQIVDLCKTIDLPVKFQFRFLVSSDKGSPIIHADVQYQNSNHAASKCYWRLQTFELKLPPLSKVSK